MVVNSHQSHHIPMDINSTNRADWERRRTIRLAQVRDQSKEIAKKIRERVHCASETQLELHRRATSKAEQKFKSLAVNKLKSDFNYLIQDIGNGYSVASLQPDPSIVQAEKRLINRYKAISRGIEAEKHQNRLLEEQQMHKEMKERKDHFNKTVEKIRSALIANVPNVEDDNNHIQNMNKHNECFLISSQVSLNESNINWNYNKKTSKPWSKVINSKEKQSTKFHHYESNNNDKENIQNIDKFSSLENDVKSYEMLVKKLKKLSAEEFNIRQKLFTPNLKEVSSSCKYNKTTMVLENNKSEEVTQAKYNIDDGTKFDKNKNIKIDNKITNESNSSLSTFISSSSTTVSNEQPEKCFKKSVQFENKTSKKETAQPANKLNYNKKPITEKPVRNVNNLLQRIKQKKLLLAKEISGDRKVNIKKSKVVFSNPKISPIAKKYTASDKLRQESPANYANLPDSFYIGQLRALKEHISKKKSKLDCSKNAIINDDLLKYINMLLKMTPSEVDDLSVSSCSSVKLEESILQYSKKNTQYYSEMLNCISKCLNADISDISQDMMLDSPNYLNFLSRLQELTQFRLEKTHEMTNICNETSVVLNDNKQITETKTETILEKSCLNISSDSSIDEEYILGHLNTLLQKKGLIKSNKEWPMFENVSDNDDNRSLTDQLLDISPH